MARPKEEIQAEIDDLLELDEWGEEETSLFDDLIEQHPTDTEDDQTRVGWYQEGAFLLRAR